MKELATEDSQPNLEGVGSRADGEQAEPAKRAPLGRQEAACCRVLRLAIRDGEGSQAAARGGHPEPLQTGEERSDDSPLWSRGWGVGVRDASP